VEDTDVYSCYFECSCLKMQSRDASTVCCHCLPSNLLRATPRHIFRNATTCTHSVCFLNLFVAVLIVPSLHTATTPRGWRVCQQSIRPPLYFSHLVRSPSPCTMASKLCCTAEQEGRSGSPELPNARVSATTPANRPLLPRQPSSPNSHFTSARSEDLHELRQIFDNARDDGPDKAPQPKVPRARHSRASVYSLHSLHKMTSMRSILRRKFSKDMPKKASDASVRPQTAERSIKEEPDTVIKRSTEDPKQQPKVTKEDLRKDLLSDKKPAEGGYDSDAEVLDDVARNIGKKTPNKRPSIHSVDWSPSTGRLAYLTQTCLCIC
jgi:hypothetical protein